MYGNLIILMLNVAFVICICSLNSHLVDLESRVALKLSVLPSTEIERLAESGITNGLTFKLCAAIGVIMKFEDCGVTIGPPRLNEYAVEPVGVEIISPSAQ